MGGSSADYGQTGGQSNDPMTAMTARQQAPANQGNMFGKMDSWNVESSHPEQIAQGFGKGLQQGLTYGMDIQKMSDGGNSASSKSSSKPQKQMVDEYGYPYTLDSSGNRVYDVGSRQIS
jgi:hypothetical protein